MQAHVAYHVEVRRSYHRARAFNLSDAELEQRVLEPWRAARPLELGDRQWKPDESTLTILEGPELDDQRLAFGQGWTNASRASRDVTARLLGEPVRPAAASTVSLLAADRATLDRAAAFIAALGLEPADWAPLRARIGAAASVAAPMPADLPPVLVMLPVEPSASFALEVGLALGACGGRCVLVAPTEVPLPAQFPGIRLDGTSAPLHAIAERLRIAGCPLAPHEGWDDPGRLARST